MSSLNVMSKLFNSLKVGKDNIKSFFLICLSKQTWHFLEFQLMFFTFSFQPFKVPTCKSAQCTNEGAVIIRAETFSSMWSTENVSETTSHLSHSLSKNAQKLMVPTFNLRRSDAFSLFYIIVNWTSLHFGRKMKLKHMAYRCKDQNVSSSLCCILRACGRLNLVYFLLKQDVWVVKL